MVDQTERERGALVLWQFHGERFTRAGPSGVDEFKPLLKHEAAVLLEVSNGVGKRATAKVVLAPTFAFVGEADEAGFDQAAQVMVE